MSQILTEHIRRHTQLTSAEEDHILSVFKKKTVKKNELILAAGDVCRYETFIGKGCFYMFHPSESGKEEIVLFAAEQWYVADLYSYLSGTHSAFSIRSLEEGEIWQVSHTQMDELLQAIPALERYFRILFQNAFVSMQSRLMENLHGNAQQRYQNFLKRFPGLHSRIPQYLIASYLGITPQYLSRVRKKWFSIKTFG